MRAIFAPPFAAVFVLVAASLAGVAAAQSPSPAETAVCLDVSGAKSPAACRAPAGRLQSAEDFCSCPTGILIKAPVCPPGVSPPPENVALKAARKTASKDGSLVGDLFEGKAMCEPARLSR